MIVPLVAGLGKDALWHAIPSMFLSGEFTSTIIIKDIGAMRNSGLASRAMFYCEFREEQKKGVVACSHLRQSSFVTNPTPTATFFSGRTWSTKTFP